MATLTLIGKGGHGQDIAASIRGFDFAWVEHHTDRWDQTGEYILGMNDLRLRTRISEELRQVDMAWKSPHALLVRDCTYGPGTHINYAVTMTRTTLGHHCTVSPGVTICGDVTIGDRTLIGAGAVICDRVTIGNNVTIGAGTIILPETVVGDGETWVGNPGRRIKP